eukprot:15448603-Alexandrium_andersonii.AAC.1
MRGPPRRLASEQGCAIRVLREGHVVEDLDAVVDPRGVGAVVHRAVGLRGRVLRNEGLGRHGEALAVGACGLDPGHADLEALHLVLLEL